MSMSESSNLEWLVALEFASNCPIETQDFIEDVVCKPKSVGGIGLKTRKLLNAGSNHSTCLLLTCATTRIKQIAQEMKVKKQCLNGSQQIYRIDRASIFRHPDDADDDLFHNSEKQRLIMSELELGWKVEDENFKMPGMPDIHLNPGDSIINQCVRYGVINQIFPLHDNQLENLSTNLYRWGSLLKSLPLDSIRDYYGESIGMYFGFLQFYTKFLILPSIVGAVYYFTGLHRTNFTPLILLAVFNLIWSTAFIEGWKRRCNSLAYHWGTWDMQITEVPRPSYHGDIKVSSVTGKLEPHYPKWKRVVQFYCVSLPVVLLCLAFCTLAMVAYFWLEDYTIAWYNGQEELTYFHEVVSFIPTIVYSVAIIVMNQLYKPLAIKLTEWENHRLQSSHDNHLTVKLVLFWFVNTFMLMFYVAFYLQDIPQLWKTLLTELVVTQAVDQLQETVVPFIMYRYRKRALETSSADSVKLIHDVNKQACKDPYEGTFDDFLELFIQFGYVTLFSCVFPLAALLAFANNLIELRSDSIKLCSVHQRPFARPVNGIGAWQKVITLMGYMAIITNTSLIMLIIHKGNILPSYSPLDLVLLGIALEHALIMLQSAVSYIIPDEDRSVRLGKARDVYFLQTQYAPSSHPHSQ